MTEATAPTYEFLDGTPADGELQHDARTKRRNDPDGTLHMMTEIGDGVFVQWSQCAKCSKRVGICACAAGPVEPEYIQRWRTQRFEKSFADRGIEPRATPYAVRQLMAEAQEAADAAYGDSNDSEIELLRGAAESAFALLGLRFPDGRDPDDEPDDDDSTEDLEVLEQEARLDDEPTALEQTLGIKPEPLAETVEDGLDAALEKVKKGNTDVGF